MQHHPRFLKLVDEVRPHIKEVSVEEVAALMQKQDNFILIDVREDSEWANGHVRRAVHMGRGVIERDIESEIPNPTEKLVLYCGGGYRSALCAYNLQKMGYSNVYSMKGGWREWTEKNLPRE